MGANLTVAIAAVLFSGLLGCGDYIEYADSPRAADEPVAAPADCPFNPASTELEYAALDALLSRTVELDADGNALVDYDRLADEGRDTLEAVLVVMACADPQPGDLAFWLNAYNVSVLRAVIEARVAQPDFRPDDGGFAFFGQRVHAVAGMSLTLDEIEHAVIRGAPREAPAHADELAALHAQLWGDDTPDARIHMAINCAARSCPNLRVGAYLGEGLDAQLTEATAAFLDNPIKGAGPRGISSLFDWFGDDFAASAGSISDFIETYRTGGLTDVDQDTFIEYDWALNGQ